jgi:hypothetical protein
VALIDLLLSLKDSTVHDVTRSSHLQNPSDLFPISKICENDFKSIFFFNLQKFIFH